MNNLREHGKLSAKELGLLEEFFKLSENEVEDLYKKFRTASDGEKSLSRRKFSNIMHQCFPRTHKSDLEDFVFKLYDINEDGQIGFLEFLMMMTIVNEGSVEQKVTQLFRAVDENKNGYITKYDLLKLVSTLFHLIPASEVTGLTSPEKVVDEIIDEIDDNEDGVITKNELVKAVERAEHLTTIVLDKILMRSTSACLKIVNKHNRQ